jgi:hypothetical protein
LEDINAVRTLKQLKVPVVMSREEVRIVINRLLPACTGVVSSGKRMAG